MNSHYRCRQILSSCAIFFLPFLITCARVVWIEYKSEVDRFAAAFPGKPLESIKMMDTAIGPIEMRMYAVITKKTSFNVVVSEYPPEHVKQVGSTALLDRARDGAVSNTQGTLISEQIIELEGNPGRELRISVSGGKESVRAKVFLVGNRLYQVVAVTPVEESETPQVRHFLESFRLL